MKRFLSCLLLSALLLSAAAAEESVSFSIPSVYGSRTASLPFQEAWFSRDPNEYHHGLARLSLAMAVSAFRGGGADAPDEAIRRFFSGLNFPDASAQPALGVQTWDYGAGGTETIAMAAAWRYVRAGGEQVPLVAVALCGANIGDEWSNSLDIGSQGDHQGFARAARKASDRLYGFLDANRLDREACVFWLAGFGRGGAVCDAAAARLHQAGCGAKLHCYTFAAPYTAGSGGAGAYGGIFNIVAASDALSQLPPAAWGFGRYGRTLYLPSSLDRQHDYAPLLSAFSAVFRQFAGCDDPLGDTDLAPMAAAALREAASQLQSRDHYRQSYQQMLYKIFTGRNPGPLELVRAGSLTAAVGRAAGNARKYAMPSFYASLRLGAFSSAELSALYLQHDPALYAGWMLSLTDGNVLLTSSLALTDMP